jgi:hypothetical protein
MAAIGCHGKGSQVAGNWKDSQGAVIQFKTDGTFEQGSGAASGKWTLSDGKVTVTIESIQGMSPEAYMLRNNKGPGQPLTPVESATLKQATGNIVLTLSDDGKTLTPTDPAIGTIRTLTKAGDP